MVHDSDRNAFGALLSLLASSFLCFGAYPVAACSPAPARVTMNPQIVTPGHVVNVSGIGVWYAPGYVGPDCSGMLGYTGSVEVTLRGGEDGPHVSIGSVTVTAGKFADTTLTIPSTAKVGSYQIILTVPRGVRETTGHVVVAAPGSSSQAGETPSAK